jgi:hypothetical protein
MYTINLLKNYSWDVHEQMVGPILASGWFIMAQTLFGRKNEDKCIILLLYMYKQCTSRPSYF